MEVLASEAVQAAVGLLVSAGAKRFAAFVREWSAARTTDAAQKKVEAWLSKHYDVLSKAVTNNSARALAMCEYGKRFRIDQLRQVIHDELDFSDAQLILFDREFHYRAEYLVLLGVLSSGMREYHITSLGVAFLAEARRRGHYSDVLSYTHT